MVSPLVGGRRQIVIPTPLIFKLVTRGPSVSRLTVKPRFFNSAVASSAKRARTSSDVLPNELRRSTTSLSVVGFVDFENGTNARSLSETSNRRSSICEVRPSGVGTGEICRRPGSPCAPIPSSMVAGGRTCRSVKVAFGKATLQRVSLTLLHIILTLSILTDRTQLRLFQRLRKRTP